MSNIMYTFEEQNTIIQYIITHNIMGNLQGYALWKQMEEEQVLNRTWQSMRSHFKNTIINMLHMFNISDYHRQMILHGFGRRSRPKKSKSARATPLRRPIPFSSDSDSDTTVCVAAQPKRARRNSSSSSSVDLLTCNANNNRRTTAAVDNNQPSTSTANANRDIRDYMASSTSSTRAKNSSKTVRKLKQPKPTVPIVISDSEDESESVPPILNEDAEQQIVNTSVENEPFSLEEDTQLIMFFQTHNDYLRDMQNNFVYVAFNYDTPSSLRTPNELRARFVEHIMPRLYTYDCLTYEEMVTYYDRADVDVPEELQQLIKKSVAEQRKNKEVAAKRAEEVEVATQAEQQPSCVTEMYHAAELPDMFHITVPDDQQEIHSASPVPETNVPDKPTNTSAQAQLQIRADIMCNTEVPVEVVRVLEHDDEVQAQDLSKTSDAWEVQQEVAAVKPVMLDATTQVQQPCADKMCNTECPYLADAATQTELQPGEDKPCNTDVIVQHVEFVSDNMLHIFLPDNHRQDPQKKYDRCKQTLEKSRIRKNKYTVDKQNDSRYLDVTVDSAICQVVIDRCESELARLTAEVRRVQRVLGQLRSYEVTGSIGSTHNESRHNWLVKDENDSCTNASVNDTTVICSSSESDDEGTADKSATVPAENTSTVSVNIPCTRGSQTPANQTGLMFDVFQTGLLHKKHASTQIDTAGGHLADLSQDDNQDALSTVISVQSSIEFLTQQSHDEPMEVEPASDQANDTDVPPLDTSDCQVEPLNLSTHSHESDTKETNTDTFYSALSQNNPHN